MVNTPISNGVAGGSPSESRVSSLSVFLPCYNEQENVRPLTQKTIEVLERVADDYEIILVDDGSRDATPEVVDALAAEHARVRVVHHEVNKGYGAALRTGFAAAGKELVFYTDGDGQFDIGELPRLLEKIGDCDIVSAYRINRQDSLLRKMNAFAWTTLVGLLFGLRIRDIDCAFKLYRREIFDRITLKSTGALIDTEILARAKRKGYRITQIGVRHYPRTAGEQTGAKLSVILRAFKELFTLYGEIRKQP